MPARASILRLALLIGLVALGFSASAYSGARLQSSAREIWLHQAHQDANRITEVALTWLSNMRTQLRGVAALHLGSSSVSEEELLDAFDVMSEMRATIPLTTVGFVGWKTNASGAPLTVITSSEFDGVLGSGVDISSQEQLLQAYVAALDMPDRVVMGPVFKEKSNQLLAAVAMAANNGDDDGAVMALIDVGDLLNSLREIHMVSGLQLRLSELGVGGRERSQAVFLDDTSADDPVEVIRIAADVGHAQWEFSWHVKDTYAGGPDYQLARFVFLTGSTLTILSGAILGLLLLQNARINRRVQDRTLELRQEIEEKSRAEEALREAVDRAETANQAKSSFLANMSHEIRTPLNAIMGFTEILDGRIRDERQKQYLDSIQASGKTLVTLIDDILDLSKVEAGILEVNARPTDVRAILQDAELVFSQKAQEKGLRLETEIDPGIPETLLIDEGRTRQILTNLVDNALKFTHQGHVKVTAAGSRRADDARMLDLIFTVTDTGIGIPDDQRERIFGAFDQSTGQSINEYGGVGRGLALIKAVLDRTNGEISVESQIGVGSTFTVTFRDVQVATEEQVAASLPDDFNPDSVSFDSATVLVADDVSANRELVKGFLDGHPLSFVEAENGEEAVELTRRLRPAIVLMDIKMPVLDGFSAAQRLKANPELRQVPVVALTGSVLRESEDEVLQVCDAFLRKPVSRSDLIRTMSSLMAHTIMETAEPSPADAMPVEAAWSPDQISPSVRERLPGLIAALMSEQEAWQDVSATLTIGDVEQFAIRLSELGNKYEYPPLTEWAEQLASQVNGFDMDGMKETLDAFPAVSQEIKSVFTSTGMGSG